MCDSKCTACKTDSSNCIGCNGLYRNHNPPECTCNDGYYDNGTPNC